jgi:hypothetical protein
MMSETQQKLQEWSLKTGKTLVDLQKMLAEQMKILTEAHPTMMPEVKEKRARSMLFADLKKLLVSPAIAFEGVYLGLAEPFDMAAQMRIKALEIWSKSPQAAVEAGVCNAKGEPLYLKGFSKGEKLPESAYIRNGFGVGKTMEGPIQPFSIVLSGERAKPGRDINTQMGKPKAFRANMKSVDKIYIMNDSTQTEFKDTVIPGMPDPVTLIDTICAGLKVNLGELSAWHTIHAKDPTRIAIVEGDVVSVDFDISDRSHRMVLDDETLGFEDASGQVNTGITCWLPKFLTPYLNFAPGSRVITIGSTTPTEGYDFKTGKPDPTRPRITINTYGVWPRPEFLIPREEAKIPMGEMKL